MSIRQIAQETIGLALARDAENRALDAELAGELGYKTGPEIVTAVLAPRPAALRLISYLESLPPNVLFKLRTLMYAGRDGTDDIVRLHHQLAGGAIDSLATESAVCSISDKSPLADYLKRGLAVAEASETELDGIWPRPVYESRPFTPPPANPITKSSPRRFLSGCDPIRDGGAVFASIAGEWSGDAIGDRTEVARFLEVLHERTAGLVILDFIDLASWDQIEGYTFDEASGDLELYWHDYRATDVTFSPKTTAAQN
jgi:hypothetical protein